MIHQDGFAKLDDRSHRTCIKTVLFLSLFLIATLPQASFTESESTEEMVLQYRARALLDDGVKRLLCSDAGKKYFAGVEVNAGKIQDHKNTASADGWIARWGFNRGMTMGPNPGKDAQTINIPIITEDSGILFEMCITYKHGGALVNRTKNYPVSDNPDINLAVYLKTKVPDPTLSEEIKQVCTIIQRALKQHLDESKFAYRPSSRLR